MKRYRTIVADPPWPYRSGAGAFPNSRAGNRNVNRRAVTNMGYSTMAMEDLLGLRPPVENDAHLYLWTTNAFLVEAHAIARAWGFDPKTMLTWVKVQPDGMTPSARTGHYYRGATEHCLFCVRGSLKLQVREALPTAYLWPRLPHSVKPDAFYDLVERASPGPYLELFARRARFGWDYWGDESLGTAEVAA